VDYWALDLETSGFDPRSDDILSVGMVPIRGGTIRWGERHYSLVRPRRGHRAAEEAMRVHHILPDEVRDAPRLCQVLEEIESRLGEAHLLVHYGKLDVGFLKIAYRRHFRIWRRTGIIDTVRLLGRLTHLRRQLDPYADSLPADLARARAELGLPRHIHHHALYDALATAELFLALTGRLGVRRLRQLR
jgi:DNA polymerase-3 subunit epsilon